MLSARYTASDLLIQVPCINEPSKTTYRWPVPGQTRVLAMAPKQGTQLSICLVHPRTLITDCLILLHNLYAHLPVALMVADLGAAWDWSVLRHALLPEDVRVGNMTYRIYDLPGASWVVKGACARERAPTLLLRVPLSGAGIERLAQHQQQVQQAVAWLLQA